MTLREFVLLMIAAWWLSLVSSPSAAQERLSCHTYAGCNQRGTIALHQGRVDEAIQLFEQQAALAERADIERQSNSRRTLLGSPYQLALTAYNNLAVAYLRKHDYLRARSWALVALRWDKENRAAQANLRDIDKDLKDWQWPKTLAGEYIQYAGRGTWQNFIVEPSSPNDIHFCFSGLWWGLGEGPSGLGELTATVPLRGNEAEYSTSEYSNKTCSIAMRFYDDRLEVKQTGSEWDCGFGHNVTADGTFQRVSVRGKCEQSER